MKPTKTFLFSNHTAEGQQTAASQAEESTWQLSNLVLISNAARAEKTVAKPTIYKHICLYSQWSPLDLGAAQSSHFQLQNSEKEHSSCTISFYPTWNWSMENFAAAWPKVAEGTTCRNSRSDKAWCSHQVFRIKRQHCPESRAAKNTNTVQNYSVGVGQDL